MSGCFNFSLVKYQQRRHAALFKSCGLESRLLDLEDGTIMRCWIPQRDKETSITSSSQKPSVVLIHAFASSGYAWNFQVKDFSKVFDLYIPDLIFFGDSTTTRPERSESFQAESVAKMLKQLSVSKYSVLGTSYGGFVAYRMAHLYPDSVEKLVISSSGVIMNSTSNDSLLSKYEADNITDVLLPTNVEGLKRVMSMAFHKQPRFPLPNFILQDYLEVVILPNYEERRELAIRVEIGKDGLPPLPTVPQDVLIVWGEFDEVFDPKLAYQLKEHIGKKAEVLLIKDAGHVPQVEKTSEYNRVVVDFLARGLSSN